MLRPENYFDNAATTPVDPRVLREMLPYLETNWGNANSLHAWGREAMHAVDFARERVTELIGAEDPSLIFFTSGATEANNWVMTGKQDVLVSPFEHSSIYERVDLRKKGLIIDDTNSGFLGNTGLNLTYPENPVRMISIMKVNNEIGTIWSPLEGLLSAEQFHSDITQAVGKIPLELRGLDYATFSAHKFYGPKGIGCLYAQMPPQPILIGGGQEGGYRSGTLNVPGIVGMGAAAAIAQDELQQNLEKAMALRATVLQTLKDVPDHQINGGENVSPYILSISFRDVEGEALVIDLDQAGFAISSGAACSSRSTDPSHVLTALKMPKEWLRGTVRISFGRLNTLDSAERLGNKLKDSVERLRNLRTN